MSEVMRERICAAASQLPARPCLRKENRAEEVKGKEKRKGIEKTVSFPSVP